MSLGCCGLKPPALLFDSLLILIHTCQTQHMLYVALTMSSKMTDLSDVQYQFLATLCNIVPHCYQLFQGPLELRDLML